MTSRSGALAAAVVAILCASCGSRHWIASADADVEEILEPRIDEVLREREEHVIQPQAAAESGKPVSRNDADAAKTVVLELGLDEALAIAVESNRDFLSRREGLYQSGLDYSLTRFQFGPQLSNSLSYLYSDAEKSTGNHSANTSFSVSQLLPTGGSLSFTSSLAGTFPEGGLNSGSDSYSSNVGVNFSQPLLRGAGYAVSHESLTQAQRSLIYAIRDFEIFRQDFTIDIASAFFALVSQKQALDNQERLYREAVYDREQAEALRSVDRNDDQAVFLARRQEITSNNSLISSRAAYQRAIDEFKIRLGLSTSSTLTIRDEKPPFEPIDIDDDSAVQCARHNRMDIETQRQRLEDARRGLAIAEQNLLPDLAFDVGYGLGGGGTTLGGALPDDYSYTAGITLTVPLQRKSERNSYVSSLIGYRQSKRAFAESLDRLELDIRAQVRELRSTEEQIQLQKDSIRQEEQAVAVTQIRFERGDVGNRDLLDARQSLTDAKNQLIQLQVNHFIGRLRLLRNLGLLFVDETGKWR